MNLRSLLVGAACGALVLTGAACGSDTSTTEASTGSSPAAGATLTIADGWAKATDGKMGEMSHMTGVFGTLKNSGTNPIHITGGSSPVAGLVEMHETVKTAAGTMQMQKTADGFTVPAGGSFELKPGANHIMLMDLTEDIVVGSNVTVVLTTDIGDVPIEVSARAFTGAQESYAPHSSH